jgi:flagellar hook-length control protein FliK
LGAEPDPNAPIAAVPAVKTAKLEPVATRLPTAPPATLAAPQQAPAAASPPPAPVVPPPEAPDNAVPASVAEALAAPQAVAEAKPAAQAAPVAPKDKAQVSKTGPGQHARIDIAAPGQAKSPTAAMATTDIAANAAGGDDTVHASAASAAGVDAKAEAPETPAGSADAGAATASTTNATTQVHPGAIPVRGAPQTVANLAAQIAKKLEGRSTRFDVQLDPAGLGRVDVRMEIGASGRMTAAMTFDTPQAAAELRARAAELQRHLEQAGFDMSGGLSFDVAGDRGQGRQAQQNQDNDSGQAFRGRAFQQALATAGQADQSAASGALNLRRSLLSGVDIRI